MFPIYNSLPEVPEAFRERYVMKGGKAVPEVSADHPLVTNNATLKTEKDTAEARAATAEARATKAESDLASASILPRGKRAVDAADAELADAVKAAGVTTADAFKTLHAEHGTLTEKVTRQERRKRLDDARKAYGWNEDAVDVLELVPDLPETEDREVTVKGEKKKLPHAKVKKGEEVTFKPLHEYLAETHAAVLRSIQSQGRKESGDWITQGDGAPPADDKKLSDKVMEGWGPKEAA
jgi:hypothetical protein